MTSDTRRRATDFAVWMAIFCCVCVLSTALVFVKGVRGHLKRIGEAEDPITGTNRDLIERHVDRTTVSPQAIR